MIHFAQMKVKKCGINEKFKRINKTATKQNNRNNQATHTHTFQLEINFSVEQKIKITITTHTFIVFKLITFHANYDFKLLMKIEERKNQQQQTKHFKPILITCEQCVFIDIIV